MALQVEGTCDISQSVLTCILSKFSYRLTGLSSSRRHSGPSCWRTLQSFTESGSGTKFPTSIASHERKRTTLSRTTRLRGEMFRRRQKYKRTFLLRFKNFVVVAAFSRKLKWQYFCLRMKANFWTCLKEITFKFLSQCPLRSLSSLTSFWSSLFVVEK